MIEVVLEVFVLQRHELKKQKYNQNDNTIIYFDISFQFMPLIITNFNEISAFILYTINILCNFSIYFKSLLE